jgi:ferredoxin--NADP+ reductase
VFEVRSGDPIAPGVTRLRVHAPRVARHWRPGQFVIVRVVDGGERIPLTIADGDGSDIDLIVQAVGKTTTLMSRLRAGDEIADVAGPLGRPSDIRAYGSVAVIGGGVGAAIAYPTASALADAGNRVVAILGGRTSRQVILEAEMRAVADEVLITTDDGSAGIRGVVTDALGAVVTGLDHVFAIGPIPMMRAVAALTRAAGVPTTVSLNPIMVDGTGMCGGCRVVVGGETKFACVDGPEFDAHLVDFDTLAIRNRAYAQRERRSLEVLVGESP